MKKLPGGREDLSNQRFGRLTALYPVEKGKYKYYWHCKCDCGEEKDILTASLKNGSSQSCGCLRKDVTHKRSIIDLTGQKFGKLTVLRQIPSYEHNWVTEQAVWECQCDCGSIVKAAGADLRSGKMMSCGCLKSKGEAIIEQLLIENHIQYVKHKRFSDCLFHEKENERGAEFDFYIIHKNKKYLVEYDGIQHFQNRSEKGWNNYKNLISTQKHDKIKNQYCLINNIPLIRIPYFHLDQITIKDLLLDTTTFLIRKENKIAYE